MNIKMSKKGIIHIVESGHYICNRAVECDDVATYDDEKMKEWLSHPRICKNCLKVLNKEMEAFK